MAAVTGQRPPLAAKAWIRSAVRAAMAWMVSDVFTAPDVGKTEPSQMKRLGMPCARPSPSTIFPRARSDERPGN
jgi:hypothetical protein